MQSGVFVSSLPWWQANTGIHQQGWSSLLQDIQWHMQYLHQLQWTVLDGSGIGGWLGCFQGRHYYISSVESIISIQTGMSGAQLTGISILPDMASWKMALRHLRSETADHTSVVNLVFPILSRPGPSLSSLCDALSNSLAALECLKYLMVLQRVLIVWSQQGC